MGKGTMSRAILMLLGAFGWILLVISFALFRPTELAEECCEPYPELGCVNVNDHVCETEKLWTRAMFDAADKSNAVHAMTEALALSEYDAEQLRMTAAAGCRNEKTREDIEALREWNAEIREWLKLSAAKAAIKACGRKVD